MPLILDIGKAKAQLDLIMALYPQLVEQLPEGLHGGWGPDNNRSGGTLKALVEAWGKAISAPKGNYAMAERSASRYETIAGIFLAHAGEDTLVSEITRETVSAFRDERLQKYGKSKKTVDLELTALRGMFRYAIEKTALKENPAEGVTVKRTKAERNRETRINRKRLPTHEEADIICTAFPDAGRYPALDCQRYAMFAR